MKPAFRSFTALLLLAATLAAQERRPMTPADVIALNAVSAPQISPDGAAVVYVVSVADTERDRRDSHLWLVRPGGTPRQITSNAGRDAAPQWAPDGQTIAFLRARPDAGQPAAQIFLLPADGGEARPLTGEPRGVASFQWAPDGESIFFLAPEGPRPPPAGRAEPQVEDEGRPRARLWRIWLSSGRQARFDAIEQHVREFAVAPDSSAVVFSAAPSGYFNDVLKSELFLLPLRETTGGDSAPRQLTRNAWTESGLVYRPDGTGFAFLAGADPAFTRSTFQESLFFYHFRTDTVHHLPVETAVAAQEKFVGEIVQAEWVDRDRLLVVAGSGANQHLYQFISSSDRTLALTRGQEVVGSISIASNRRVVFLRQSPQSSNDVWVLELNPSGMVIGGRIGPPEYRALTDHNPQARGFALPQYEVIRWKASDGVEVEGILLTPAEASGQGKGPWPLVTRIHGGPASAEQAGFLASGYVLTGMGIAVFLPNYRGSTNYGEDFAARSIGDRNGRDARDIEEGIDALIARGIADKERLGVMGWSAGGVLTNWLIATNSRYRAASSGAGVADWTLQYFLSDYAWGSRLYFEGTPWQKHELYRDRSPLRLAAQVKTPTLIHSGANDERVPTAHCRAWYRALRDHGVTARFVVYPGEPHTLQQPAHQLRRIEEDAAWFRQYLLSP